jgi:hypothetical protein
LNEVEGSGVAHAELPDFSGKLVVFYVSSPPAQIKTGVLLQYAEFRRFGERLFVIGHVPENWGWSSGLQSAVAWDSVIYYLIFDSREDYERRRASARPSRKWRLFE